LTSSTTILSKTIMIPIQLSALLLLLSRPVLSMPLLADQALLCPPPVPGLEMVVDTAEKCMCFYALAASNLDTGDPSTFETVYNDDSVLEFAQAGKYYGADGIAEYLSFIAGGLFIEDFILIGMPLFLDFTGSNSMQCVATIAQRRRLPLNPVYTVDNQDICVDVLNGSTLYYTMTGDPAAPITIQRTNAWLPNALISETLPYINTPATAEFVCDVNVNICKNKSKSTKSSKKKKSTKSSKKMQNCVKKFNEFPPNESGAVNWIDGNSKGCRILHSYFASNNDVHCPHVSFEADADINGLVKCNDSEGVLPTDIFSQRELGLFSYAATTLLGLGESGIDIKMGACPSV
jgi:hypothetical protein